MELTLDQHAFPRESKHRMWADDSDSDEDDNDDMDDAATGMDHSQPGFNGNLPL